MREDMVPARAEGEVAIIPDVVKKCAEVFDV